MFSIGWREKHARGTLSALVSCILHTALFIGLACTYYAIQEPRPASTILQAALAGAGKFRGVCGRGKSGSAKADELSVPAPATNTEFELNVDSQLASANKSLDATLSAALASVSRSGGNGGVRRRRWGRLTN